MSRITFLKVAMVLCAIAAIVSFANVVSADSAHVITNVTPVSGLDGGWDADLDNSTLIRVDYEAWDACTIHAGAVEIRSETSWMFFTTNYLSQDGCEKAYRYR